MKRSRNVVGVLFSLAETLAAPLLRISLGVVLFWIGCIHIAEPPFEAAMFEDARGGVEAGRAGRFGFVVGVDRVGQTAALRQHGADIVVADLPELLAEP
jgi:beta-phosphoglucomutase-like phosphatase (HAD superfamily)